MHLPSRLHWPQSKALLVLLGLGILVAGAGAAMAYHSYSSGSLAGQMPQWAENFGLDGHRSHALDGASYGKHQWTDADPADGAPSTETFPTLPVSSETGHEGPLAGKSPDTDAPADPSTDGDNAPQPNYRRSQGGSFSDSGTSGNGWSPNFGGGPGSLGDSRGAGGAPFNSPMSSFVPNTPSTPSIGTSQPSNSNKSTGQGQGQNTGDCSSNQQDSKDNGTSSDSNGTNSNGCSSGNGSQTQSTGSQTQSTGSQDQSTGTQGQTGGDGSDKAGDPGFPGDPGNQDPTGDQSGPGDGSTGNPAPTAIPEPSTVWLTAAGLALMVFYRRRSRARP